MLLRSCVCTMVMHGCVALSVVGFEYMFHVSVDGWYSEGCRLVQMIKENGESVRKMAN